MVTILGIIALIALAAFALKSLVDLYGERPRKAAVLTALLLLATYLIFGSGGVSVGDFFGGDQMSRVLEMAGTVVISVAVCVGLWVVLNMYVSQADRSWSQFSGLTGAVLGAAFFGLLRGNFSVDALIVAEDPALLNSGSGFLGRLEWPLAGALIFGVGSFVIKGLSNRMARLAVGAIAGGGAGVLIAINTKVWQRPDLDWAAVVVCTLVLGAIGAATGSRTGRVERGALLGAGVGFAIGSWLLSPFLVVVSAPILGTAIPLALIMMGFAWEAEPSSKELARFDNRARAFVFVGPALSFLVIALIVPAIRTGVLSFKDRTSTEYVGFENYSELFGATDSADVSNWTNIFTSRLFYAAMILVVISVLVALIGGIRQNGHRSIERGPTSTGAMLLAVFLFSFAALSVLRGTFFNNLWWVITVVSVATALGLAVAVLADRASWGENAAKSLIFMPMAISFVGASIVWRLQYQARDIRKNQTGVLNAVWVELGKLSNSGAPRMVVIVVLAVIVAALLYRIVNKVRGGEAFTGLAVMTLVFGWLLYRFLGPRLGGFTTNAQGELVPETIQFLTERPFNNVFLMVILIWMQTGFAMVIFSAAIKAVPTEFIEAAKVDGATESQTFFNITLPSILPTVGVVVTTMIVQVTKVYDIVAVAGLGGRFGNNVLANQMFNESFQINNKGLGAAIAIVMFLVVLPVMIYNIYNMQKEAV